MNNKQFAIVSFLLGVSIMSFICAVAFMIMAKDLRNEVIELKESGCIINVKDKR